MFVTSEIIHFFGIILKFADDSVWTFFLVAAKNFWAAAKSLISGV